MSTDLIGRSPAAASHALDRPMTTMFDCIASLHRKLSEEDPEYFKFIAAKYDAAAVSGDLLYDTFVAAMILQRAAAEAGDTRISTLRLAYIGDVINALLGRALAIAPRAALTMGWLRGWG